MHVCTPAQWQGAAYLSHHAKYIGMLAHTGIENMRPMWRGLSATLLPASGEYPGRAACPLSRLLVARQREVGMPVQVFMPCRFYTVSQNVAATVPLVCAHVTSLRLSTTGG